jgi:hypothetical protein
LYQLSDWRGVAEALRGLATVALALHEPERAVRLYAASEQLCNTHNVRRRRADLAELEQNTAAARTQLGEAAFAAAWAAGQAQTLAEAVALALAP